MKRSNGHHRWEGNFATNNLATAYLIYSNLSLLLFLLKINIEKFKAVLLFMFLQSLSIYNFSLYVRNSKGIINFNSTSYLKFPHKNEREKNTLKDKLYSSYASKKHLTSRPTDPLVDPSV